MHRLQVLDTFLTECTANAGNHLSFWWVNPTHLSKQAKGNERHDGAKFQWVNSRNITIAYGIDVNTATLSFQVQFLQSPFRQQPTENSPCNETVLVR